MVHPIWFTLNCWFVLSDLTSRWFHTHTPLRVVHSIFSSYWHVRFGPESRKPVFTWDLVRSVWKGSTFGSPISCLSACQTCPWTPRAEPLVRCLFIDIFCYLRPRLAYLFIYLFNIEPLGASIPLRPFLYIIIRFLFNSARRLRCFSKTWILWFEI